MTKTCKFTLYMKNWHVIYNFQYKPANQSINVQSEMLICIIDMKINHKPLNSYHDSRQLCHYPKRIYHLQNSPVIRWAMKTMHHVVSLCFIVIWKQTQNLFKFNEKLENVCLEIYSYVRYSKGGGGKWHLTSMICLLINLGSYRVYACFPRVISIWSRGRKYKCFCPVLTNSIKTDADLSVYAGVLISGKSDFRLKFSFSTLWISLRPTIILSILFFLRTVE